MYKVIKWTSEEKEILSYYVMRYLQDHPTHSKLKAVNECQRKLFTVYRQRVITSMNAIPWLDIYLEKFNIKDTEISLELSKIPFEKIVEELLNRIEKVIKVDFSKIEQHIENRIVSRINDLESKLIERIHQREVLVEPEFVSDAKIVKEKKKKILLVGMTNNQFNEISKYYVNSPIDVKHWSNTESGIPKLKGMLKYIDKIILITNFISHEVDNLVKNSSRNYTRINGGLTTIKDELDKQVSSCNV
jgi:hypothetical protein